MIIEKLKVALILVCLCATNTLASENYADHPGAQAVIDELVQDQGFDRQQLQALFASAKRQDSILEAMSRPAEKTKPWYDYREIFLTQRREQEGIKFYNEHLETLQRAERELGVPAEMIVAIIGVETYYGRIAGSYRVIDALSTLAFDYPKRATFFTKELKNYLILTNEQNMNALDMKGSYAGAMGYGQFMPSSYRSYAIDFDDDGKIDIWNNPVDAIGSVANYFKAHGWSSGEPVVAMADVAEDVDPKWFNAGLKPQNSIGDLSQVGIVSRQALDADLEATAIKFELEDGFEYWLGLHNFYVITRYNHSAMYAMCVYQLSQRLAVQIAR